MNVSTATTGETQIATRTHAVRLVTVAVVGITLLALGLRLYCLDCWGLWNDEVISVEVAQGGPQAILANRFGWLGNQTPAYYLVLWLLTLVGDPTQTSVFVRLPAVVAGALAVPLLYLLGRDTLGRSTGLVAATILALSLPALNYSQDARQYSVTLFLTLLAFYAVIRIRLGGPEVWWVVYTGAMAADVLYSYLAVTLAGPPMALLAAWVLLHRWKHRGEMRFRWIAPIIAAAVVGAAALYSGLQAALVPSEPIDLGRITVAAFAYRIPGDWMWLLRTGLPGNANVLLALYMIPVVAVGFVAGFKQGSGPRLLAAYATPLLLIPEIELLVLGTSKGVLPRYILFVLPFLLLLLAHGAIALADMISSVPAKKWPALSDRARATAAALFIGLFAIGAVNYYNPATFVSENTRPEFRRAASYIRTVARPGDLIVVTCDLPHASTVLNFYWNGAPPVPTYDALDPTLYSLPAPQRLIVVIGGQAGDQLEQYFRREGTKIQYTYEMSTVVLTIDGGGRSLDALMNSWITYFASAVAHGRMVLLLQGSLYQARGDTVKAAELFAEIKLTDGYVPLWREHVAASEGFQATGDTARAWRELIIAKFENGGDPEVHRLLARELAGRGLHEQAAQEERVADELDMIAVSAAGER